MTVKIEFPELIQVPMELPQYGEVTPPGWTPAKSGRDGPVA